MKILHVVNAYPTTENKVKGIFIKEQIDSIIDEGVDCQLLIVDKEKSGMLSYMRAYFFLVCHGHKFEIIHAHHVFSALLVIFSLKSRKRLFTSFLSDSYNEVMFGPKFLRVLCFEFVRKLSVVKIFKTNIGSGFQKNEFLIQNGVDTDFFKIQSRDDSVREIGGDVTKPHLLFVSGQSLDRPEKRYDLFLETVQILKKKYFINIHTLTMSNVSRAETVKYYNAADCYLLTSDFEGSPNAVKEALSCGVPVISRGVGILPMLLKDVPYCLALDTKSPEVLAEHVYKLLTTSNAIDRQVIRRTIFEYQLDKKKVAQKLIGLYRKHAQYE